MPPAQSDGDTIGYGEAKVPPRQQPAGPLTVPSRRQNSWLTEPGPETT